jgi:creatinine amidohydrolase
MLWEELTGDEFAQAVQQVDGVCLLPLSCIERHAHHLPLGTDMYIGREMCKRAANLETAMVFPDMIYTQILEARHCAGTIAIEPEVIVALLGNVIREIARNGLKKIILVNAHGGNNALMTFLTQMQMRGASDYVLYAWNPLLLADDRDDIQALWESTLDGHAGEKETSAIMAIRPDLVRIAELHPDGEGMPMGRLSELRAAGLTPGIWWYADHPTHYRGDGTPASAEKGDRYLEAVARALANAIRLVKQDQVSPQLQEEFFAAATVHST